MRYVIEFLGSEQDLYGEPTAAETIAQANRVLREALDTREGAAGYFLAYVEGCAPDEDARAELARVQSTFDRNAVVSARTARDAQAARAMLGNVPPASIVCAPSRVCLRLRGCDLASFGLLDETCITLDVALAEFALRLNNYGYSSITANRALVSTASVPDHEIAPLMDVDVLRRTLGERYPSFRNVDILREAAWLDEFLPFELDASSRKPRILFEFSDMMPWYCGTTEYQLALLQYFYQLYADRYDFFIRVNREAMEFHRLRQSFGSVYLPEDPMPLCDVGLVAAQPLTVDQQVFLNSHCSRIVYTMLDCILLRTSYSAAFGPHRADLVRSGLRYADGIISISDFGHDDYKNFLQWDAQALSVPQRTVYISSDSDAADITPEDVAALPFEEYVLVPGNFLRHKCLSDVFRVVANTSRNYVFMGIERPEGWEGDLPANTCCLKGGGLSESFISCLYEHASCVVFASQYEGFGLPITIAWKHGKKAVVCDNSLNRELFAHFSHMQPNLLFFSTFDQVPEAVEKCLTSGAFEGHFETTWQPAIEEVEQFVREVLARPVDWLRMDERQWHFRLMDEVKREGAHEVGFRRLVDERYLDGHPARSKAVHDAAHVARVVLRRD